MDKSELNTLYLTYRKKVYHLALYYVKDAYLAEDISHEVLIKCYVHREKFKGDCSLDTWIVRVAKNHCIDYLRKSYSRRITLYDSVDLFEDQVTPEDLILSQFKNEELKCMVNQLPEKYKMIIILYYYKDLSLNDIQSLLNLNLSTIKTRMYRARQRLKAMYKNERQYEQWTHSISDRYF